MTNLKLSMNAQRREFEVVIEALDKENNYYLIESALQNGLDRLCCSYVFLHHENEPKLNENGEEFKHDHYHLYIRFNTRIRKSTLINYLKDVLGMSELCYSVGDVTSASACVQYFDHHKIKDKVQYDKSLYYYNIETEVFESLYYNETDKSFDCENPDHLIKLVDTYRDDIPSLIKALGVGNYNQLRGTIFDLRNYFRGKD